MCLSAHRSYPWCQLPWPGHINSYITQQQARSPPSAVVSSGRALRCTEVEMLFYYHWLWSYLERKAARCSDKFRTCSTSRFFFILCAPHQLDLIKQKVDTGLLSDAFRANMVALIANPRRQYKLHNEKDTTFPTISTTRWLSLGNTQRWMSTHRSKIIQCNVQSPSADLPESQLWIPIVAVKVHIDPTGIASILCKAGIYSSQNKTLLSIILHQSRYA